MIDDGERPQRFQPPVQHRRRNAGAGRQTPEVEPPAPPVAEPFTPEVADILARYPSRDGYVLQLFRVFANSMRFLNKGAVKLLDRNSPLGIREREIVILRVCANNDCEYEWGVHVSAFAERAGLSAVQVTATRNFAARFPVR